MKPEQYQKLIDDLRAVSEHTDAARERDLFRRSANAMADLLVLARELDRILNLPNCNECLKKHTCPVVPRAGDTVVINCPVCMKEVSC